MLILAYTDALGVDLDKLSKWIHQTTSYRDSSTNGDILIRELFASNLRGRIDRGTILTDSKDLGLGSLSLFLGVDIVATCQHILDEIVGLTTGSTITDGDGFDLVFLNHLLNGDSRLRAFVYRRMGEDGIMMQQVALCIETNHLTTCTESRIDAHDAFLSEWSTQEQLTQILCKDPYGFLIGTLFTECSEFCLDSRFEQSFVTILDGLCNEFTARGVAIDIMALQTFYGFVVVR